MVNEIIELFNNSIKCKITLNRGNLITSISKDGEEILLLREDNYYSLERPRCGIPMMFPYYGTPDNNEINIDGEKYPAEIHGIIHSAKWKLIEINEDSFISELNSDEGTLRKYPFKFNLKTKISLYKNKINFDVNILNLSKNNMPCDIGFHPFFLISNLDNLSFCDDAKEFYDLEKDEIIGEKTKESILTQGCLLMDCSFCQVKDNKTKRNLIIRNIKGLDNILLWSGDKDEFLVIEPL